MDESIYIVHTIIFLTDPPILCQFDNKPTPTITFKSHFAEEDMSLSHVIQNRSKTNLDIISQNMIQSVIVFIMSTERENVDFYFFIPRDPAYTIETILGYLYQFTATLCTLITKLIRIRICA